MDLTKTYIEQLIEDINTQINHLNLQAFHAQFNNINIAPNFAHVHFFLNQIPPLILARRKLQDTLDRFQYEPEYFFGKRRKNKK